MTVGSTIKLKWLDAKTGQVCNLVISEIDPSMYATAALFDEERGYTKTVFIHPTWSTHAEDVKP